MLPKNLKMENIMVPVLHLGIGFNNDGTAFVEDWLKRNVECRSLRYLQAEAERRGKEEALVSAGEDFKRWMEERGEDLIKGDINHYTVMDRAWQNAPKPRHKMVQDGQGVPMAGDGFRLDVLAGNNAAQNAHFADRNEWARKIEELAELKKELVVLVAKEKEEEEKWKKETSYSDQMGQIIDDALNLIDVQRECFNGKQLNGMQGRELQHKSDRFVAGLKDLVMKYIAAREEAKVKIMTWAASEEEIKNVLEEVGQSFKLLGLIMTTLRSVVDVPQEEIDELPSIVDKYLAIYEWMRKKMGRKEKDTHKSHLLRKHTHFALNLFKNTGRDAEDPIEGSHNVGNKLMRKNMSTKDPNIFMSSMMNDFYAANLPAVRQKMATQEKAMKRKFKEMTTVRIAEKENGKKAAKAEYKVEVLAYNENPGK